MIYRCCLGLLLISHTRPHGWIPPRKTDLVGVRPPYRPWFRPRARLSLPGRCFVTGHFKRGSQRSHHFRGSINRESKCLMRFAFCKALREKVYAFDQWMDR